MSPLASFLPTMFRAHPSSIHQNNNEHTVPARNVIKKCKAYVSLMRTLLTIPLTDVVNTPWYLSNEDIVYTRSRQFIVQDAADIVSVQINLMTVEQLFEVMPGSTQ